MFLIFIYLTCAKFRIFYKKFICNIRQKLFFSVHDSQISSSNKLVPIFNFENFKANSRSYISVSEANSCQFIGEKLKTYCRPDMLSFLYSKYEYMDRMDALRLHGVHTKFISLITWWSSCL